MRFEMAGYSDAGAVKETNQDSYCMMMADTLWGDIALLAVADGMGGLQKGELASATAVQTLKQWFEKQLPALLEVVKNSVEGFENSIAGQWNGLVQDLNLKIMRHGIHDQMNLGTALTAILFFGARYSIVHVGDSRVYEITDGGIVQLTTDQTFVCREMQAGRMTQEEADVHPRRNVLLQCIGSSKSVEPEIIHGNTNRDAVYLVCSDGFRHQVSPEELVSAFGPRACLESGPSTAPEACIKKVVDTCIERGEQDNITAVTLKAKDGEG